jgi:hypothetical protein
MSWDRTLPTGSLAVNASDNAIRANWDYLRDAIRQEHGDPDAFPSTTAQIVHLQGSARAIIYTGATILDSSADVVAAVTLYHDSRDIGRIVFDKNVTATPGAVWYCTAVDTFVEITRIWSNVIIAGTAGITGLVTASGGVTIPTTKLLTGPTGENWLVNGAQQMNPLIHAARHLFGGQDVLAGIIASNIIYKTGAGPITVAGTLVTSTYDFSARTGNTLIVAIGFATMLHSGSASGKATMSFQLNDVDKGMPFVLAGQDTASSLDLSQAGATAAAFLVPNAAAQKIDLELKTITKNGGGGSQSPIQQFGMLLIDLATVGLTT